MQSRRLILLLTVGTVAIVIVALTFRAERKVPTVRLLHLTQAIANPPASGLVARNWLAKNFLDDPLEVWFAEFEIYNPPDSGTLFSYDKIDVQFLDATDRWTNAVQQAQLIVMDVFPVPEFTSRITKKRIRALVPTETQRCRLTVRVRPLTAQERCREMLAKSGLWRRLPTASAWISDRMPQTKYWSEWKPEIDLPRVPIEQDVRNELTGWAWE